LPAQARFCPHCGGTILQTPAQPQAEIEPAIEAIPEEEAATADSVAAAHLSEAVLPVPENIAAVVAYLTLIPAVLLLYLEPFRRNRFVRFHALQHILLGAAGLVCAVAATILWMVLQLIPPMRVLVFPFAGLIGLAWFFLWLLLVVKAYHHEMFKLPVIGDVAEEWSHI